jgi:LmbE family N-acetylglucosaminyl deacetylase
MNEFLSHDQGKKVLMIIFPHPDDETMATGGLLLVARQLGWQTVAVVLTKGEAGRIHINGLGRSVKEIRTEELKKAARILKIDQLVVDDFGDGCLRGQEEKIEKWLLPIIKKYQPAIIITYDHSGITGHPDHITVSLVVKKLVKKFSGKKPLLLWVSFWKSLTRKWPNQEVVQYYSYPDYQLNLGWGWFKKWLAARAHKSQALGKGWFLPLGLTLFLNPYEWYHKVDLKKDYPFRYVDYRI